MPNTNAQTIHQMGSAINSVVRQATGRDAVGNIDMDFVTVAQNKTVLSVSDSVPYLRRNTGGGVNIGNATLARDKIIGGSLAWNQLVQNGNFAEEAELWNVSRGTLSFSNGICSYSVQDVSGAAFSTAIAQNIVIPAGHKIIVTFDINPAHSKQMLVYALNGAGNPSTGYKQVTGRVWNRFNGIINTGNGNVSTLQLALGCTSANGYSVNDVDQIKNVNCFDLNQMFGTTIADYIYSLESANAGAGVAFFREFFPNEFYEYNAGELKSVEGLQSHKTTGDGWERTYPLDSSLILRGLPKLNSDNKLYYDGDEYKADGTVTRKYGIVDLGALNWVYINETGHLRFQARASDNPSVNAKGYGDTAIPNTICSGLISDTFYNVYYNITPNTISINSSKNITVYAPAYTDAATLKTAMSGVYLVYELATPTTETATPYTDQQEVSANGTEQYVTNSIIPVGHETEYFELVEV